MASDVIVPEMEFCLLGPLVVRRLGAIIPVPVGKQRAVLAALLLDADRVLRLDELAEALWGPSPPPSARVTVQNHIMRLRHALGDSGRARIRTQPGGYSIEVGTGELDVARFESLLGGARAAARDGRWAMVAAQASSALALWRGEPLADAGSETLTLREVPRLEEMRLQALEARIEADLRLGAQAGVIGELRKFASRHPLREHVHELLMLALYLDGRQSEALAAYRQARVLLVAELGTEPGAGLRALQQQILTADPALPGPDPGRLTSRDHLAVPRQLPGQVRHFTGRKAELATLDELLDAPDEQGAAVISSISGTAGIGKTALALRWAHQVADRFPDGQLYVNLRGYDLEQPMRAADALASLLRALGVSGLDIPPGTEERAARYRSLLAGRRVLVLLDNAADVEQVRPLLPGTPGCVALVTSRDALGGLVAREGARRLDLDLLPLADAVSLLRTLIGERAIADPVATAELAERCCRLPLALRVTAELAAARPGAPVPELVAELADRQRRLDLLEAGADPRTAVRAVFSWSYRHLSPAAARTFRLAGLHPGTELDAYAAAALTGSTEAEAAHVLSVLARAHLIYSTGAARYGMHDLLRAYTVGQVIAQDGPDGQQGPLTGLFDYYLHTAAIAMDTLYPAEHHRRPGVARPETPVPPLADPAAARSWLDAERDNLIAAATYAADYGWPGHTIRLAAILSRYLDTGGHYPEAISIHTCARRAAHAAGDRAAEARALSCLGGVSCRQSRYLEGAGHIQLALALFREIDDRAGEASSLGNLGIVDFQQGRYPQAAGHIRQAVALFREIGDPTGEARNLGNLGDVELRQGRYPQAADCLMQALALCRETGNRTGEARVLNNLGDVELRQGRHPQAADHLRQALALCHEFGDRLGEAHVLANLGVADWRQGRHPQAADHLGQALAVFRETGDRDGEAEVLNNLGEAFLATGQLGQAMTQHAAALDVASQTGNKYQQARACHGLGNVHQAAGDHGQARQQWEEALTLHTSLGAPEADDVRAQLGS